MNSDSASRLEMQTARRMRDLAQRLLTYEAFPVSPSEPPEPATVRVYERLRRSLGEFAGVTGFQSLASRALARARTEVPELGAVQVAADGALQGFGEMEHRLDMDKVHAGEFPAGEAGIVLIAAVIHLLQVLLGEASTNRLLRVTWPGADFDDCSSKNGRNA